MNIPCLIQLGNTCLAEHHLSTREGHPGLNTITVRPGGVFCICWPLLQPELLLQMQSIYTGWENVFLQWLLWLLVCRGTSVLPQRFPICVLILAHPHPQELCCQARSKSLRYLCRPAVPGQLSTAAGRCREPPEHSMWMVSFVSEALKTNRSRIDTLSHLFHCKFWSLPAISGLTTTNKQCFPMMGCSKVPRWDCQVLQARQAAFLSPGLCTAIHLVILANLSSSLPSRLNPHYNIMKVVVFPFCIKKLPISITFSCPGCH